MCSKASLIRAAYGRYEPVRNPSSHCACGCEGCRAGIPARSIVGQPHAETIAASFHSLYERLAPIFGYETRTESAVPWPDVPVENRKLMVAVVDHLIAMGLIR